MRLLDSAKIQPLKNICDPYSVAATAFAVLGLSLLVVSASLIAPAQAASFDCSRAIEPDEVAVCSHPHLSQLDTEMGALWYSYSKFPMWTGAGGARQDDADAFLQKRGACGSNVRCLEQVYRARITDLKEDIAITARYMSN